MRTRFAFTSSSSLTEEGTDEAKAVLENAKGLTSRELLKQSVEEMVSDINAKRKRDAAMLEGMLSRCKSAFIYHSMKPIQLNNVPLTFTWLNLETESFFTIG